MIFFNCGNFFNNIFHCQLKEQMKNRALVIDFKARLTNSTSIIDH